VLNKRPSRPSSIVPRAGCCSPSFRAELIGFFPVRMCSSSSNVRFETDLFADGEYEMHSNEAHGVMAVAVLCCVAAYGIFFLGAQGWDELSIPRCVRCIPASYALSGSSLFSSGLYLAVRVLLVCQRCLAQGYVFRDVIQRQHLAVAALLISGGGLEILHAGALVSDSRQQRRLTELYAAAEQGTTSPRGLVGGDNVGCCPGLFLRRFLSGWIHELWFGATAMPNAPCKFRARHHDRSTAHLHCPYYCTAQLELCRPILAFVPIICVVRLLNLGH
jgi:hypothetical protein